MEEKTIKGLRNYVCVRLRLRPCDPANFRLPYRLKVIRTQENNLQALRAERLHAIEDGVRTGLGHGSILGFPVINCQVELLEFECSFTTMHSIIAATAQRCVHDALKQAGAYLLEPIMRLEIVAPETCYGQVMRDLSGRRSQLAESSVKNRQRVITAFTPLAEIAGYSSDLRRLSSGKANLFMQLHDYQRMNQHDQLAVCRKINGYL